MADVRSGGFRARVDVDIVIGEALPGQPFGAEVDKGHAVRVTTGAPIPAGADAVVPVEDCEESDGTLSVRAPSKNTSVARIGYLRAA